MIQLALRGTFACGLALTPDFSEYHDVHTLNMFQKSRYARRGDKLHVSKGREFNPHGYTNLGDFYSKALQWSFPRQDYTLVCYGGTFAVSQHRLLSLFRDETFTKVMKSIESALHESNMSVTEHFVERTWAGLLSEPLTDEDASFLQSTMTGILKDRKGVYGALFIGTDHGSYQEIDFGDNSSPSS